MRKQSGDQPRWQKEQKEKKQKRNFLVVRLWLFVICLLLLGGITFKVFQLVRASLWNGRDRINFVLKGEETILASFEPSQESVSLILIPGQTLLEVCHGYGKYKVEAIPGLEKLEKREALLAESVQESLGVPVDGWIGEMSNVKCSASGGSNVKEKILCEIGNQIFQKKITNFSRWDLARLWWEIKKVKAGNTEVLDLGKLNVLTQSKLPDGTTVFEIDSSRLDPLIQKYLSDFALKQEGFSIEVLNGTTHLGLAEKGARILSNLGGEVVWVGNSEASSEKCVVGSGKNKKGTYTVRKIIKIFGCSWQEKKEEGKAEITVILGEDYWRKLNQK